VCNTGDMAANKKEKLVAVRMPIKMVQNLERIGKELDRPSSWVIRAAVTEYVNRRQGQPRHQGAQEPGADRAAHT
jgi:predicted transcriptional regulator